MMKIEKEYGHWRLPVKIKNLLLECKAKEPSRYAINKINVSEKALAATDGKRLVEIRLEHKISTGIYFCTEDGFLLNTTEEKFPKYTDIIPPKNTLREIVNISSIGNAENIIGLILGELCRSGCICKLSLYEEPVMFILDMLRNVNVYVDIEAPPKRPFVIEGDSHLGHIRYIQMPIIVENEI